MTTSGWTGNTCRAAATAFAAVFVLGQASAWADAPSVVGDWRFDEAGGQRVVDSGPFGLDGLLGASDGADAADPDRIPGVSGGALHFDGSTYVRLPDSPRLSLQRMTVEAEIRAGTSPGNWRYVVSRGGSGCWAGSWGLYTAASGGMAFYVFDGTRYVVSATARRSDVWDGDWHRVTGTFDGGSLRLYVDGRPVGDPMDAPLRVDYATTTSGAAIGAYVGECDLPFVGDVDQVRITDGALGAAAVASPFKRPADSDPAPLPAAEPGTILPYSGPGPGAPPAPPRTTAPACVIKLSRSHVTAHRKTVVTARVGTRKATVVARRTSHGKPLAKARSNAAGVARLTIRAPRTGRLTISLDGRQSCAPAKLRVVSR